MPGSSNLGVWVYTDDDILEPDYPVSTAYSWQVRDNLAHLTDSQCQTPVSWMGSASRNDHFTLPAGLDAFYSVEFPITILSPGYLPGLRFNQWIYSNDAANTVTSVMRLRYANDPLFPVAAAGSDPTALYSATNTTVSTSGQKKTNYFTNVASRPIDGLRARQQFSIEENSDDHTTEVAMVRAEIYMSDSAGDGGGLIGFQVIEFAAWP